MIETLDNALSAEECRDICSLAETDGNGTVSLAEEDLEFVCAQAAIVPALQAQLHAAQEKLQALAKAYNEAPGLPLETAPHDALMKWTDFLTGVGFALCDEITALESAALAQGGGRE